MRSEKEKSATDWVLSLYRLVAHFKLLLSFSSLQTWCEFSHPWEHKKQESQDRNFEPECCVIYKNANLESSSLAHLSLWCEKHFIYLFFLNARLVISLQRAAFIHILAKILNHLLSELYGAAVFSTFDALNLKLLCIEEMTKM